ncbi:kinesin-like protein KIF19 [Pontoporia blainvillei]|uniref:Kinesin-like protein KIF19 n=1 Tax=Pontoporia blainvillei TaxID=48723 RepID=A0ABX0S9T5_PONBL|nr:kinesin-like protein KIF19 [Pontoporia blainvillei]
MDRVASGALQDSSLPQISRAGTLLTPESDPESVKTLSSEAQLLQGSFLPPISTESEANHVSKASSGAWQVKSSSVPTPPPIQIGSLVTQKVSTGRRWPDGLLCCRRGVLEVQRGEEYVALIPGWVLLCPAADRKEILTDTKCISAKAARRRSRALGAEGRHLPAPSMERSSLSLNSLNEADDARPPGPLACKRPPSPMLQHAASEDNLSSSTGEAPPRAVEHRGDGPGPWLRGQKKILGKKREELLEAKRRKRRSQSFEVTGQGVSPGARTGGSGPLPCWWGSEGWIAPAAPGYP